MEYRRVKVGVLCSGVSAGVATDCPNNASMQFNVNITNGAGAVSDDTIDFALTAASGDAYQPKKLQFAKTTGSGFNNEQSKITIVPGAGFRTVGNPLLPA